MTTLVELVKTDPKINTFTNYLAMIDALSGIALECFLGSDRQDLISVDMTSLIICIEIKDFFNYTENYIWE